MCHSREQHLDPEAGSNGYSRRAGDKSFLLLELLRPLEGYARRGLVETGLSLQGEAGRQSRENQAQGRGLDAVFPRGTLRGFHAAPPPAGRGAQRGPTRRRGGARAAGDIVCSRRQDRRIEELAGLLNQYRRMKEIVMATQRKRTLSSQRYSSRCVASRGSPAGRCSIFIRGRPRAGQRSW